MNLMLTVNIFPLSVLKSIRTLLTIESWYLLLKLYLLAGVGSGGCTFFLLSVWTLVVKTGHSIKY